MITEEANPDADLLSRIRCYRRQGYEPVFLAFVDPHGNATFITAIDTKDALITFLTELLNNLADQDLDTPTAH